MRKNFYKHLLTVLLGVWGSACLISSAHSSSPSAIDQLLSQESNIIGLEAIIAAGSDDAFYSRFGHAMIRFVKADGVFETDYVLSLEANVPDNQINAMKGVFGGYQVVPIVQSFGDFWEEYVQQEERPLSRYIVLSTPALRHQLLTQLKAWSENPKLSGDYTFLKNNCVGALAKLLDDSGFPTTIGIYPVIPTDWDTWLSESLLSPFPATQMQSPKDLYTKFTATLKISVDQSQTAANWPVNSAELIEAQLSDLEIKQLLLQMPQMPEAIRQSLVAKHNFSNGGANLDQVMTYKAVPTNLYAPCSTDACATQMLQSAQATWSASDFTAAMKRNDNAFWESFGDHNANDEVQGTVSKIGTVLDNYSMDLKMAPKSISRDPEIAVGYQLALRAWVKSL
jgi:Domain of unknown function (DUF4105)